MISSQETQEILCQAIALLFALRYAAITETDSAKRHELTRKSLYLIEPAIQQYTTYVPTPSIPLRPSYLSEPQVVESVISFDAPEPSSEGYLVWEHHHFSMLAVLFSTSVDSMNWQGAFYETKAITRTIPHLHLLMNHLRFDTSWSSTNAFEGCTMYNRVCAHLFCAWRDVFDSAHDQKDSRLIDEAVNAGTLICCEHVSVHHTTPQMLGNPQFRFGPFV